MGTVKRFLKAVFQQWKAELLGGALIALLGLVSDFTGVAVPPRVYEIAAALLIFYAVFLAWSDEESKKLATEARVAELEAQLTNKPGLRFSVRAFEVGRVAAVLNIKAEILITNPGEQTSVHSWQAGVSLRSGERIATTSLWKNLPEIDGQSNLATDQRLIEHGATREGVVSFTLHVASSNAKAADVRQIFFQCYDSFDRFYEMQSLDLGPGKPETSETAQRQTGNSSEASR